jgi:UDP-N-acetylmuramoylalanine--D-glutamate ligase
MISHTFAKDKFFYVVGLGLSNRAAIKALQKSEAHILIWDDNPDNFKGFDESLITPPDAADWGKMDYAVISPGISPANQAVIDAEAHKCPVICDVELYMLAEHKGMVIGVTGTNGKSTVTALITHILSQNHIAQMGGNIGKPVLSLKKNCDFTVLELSSYQLDRTPGLHLDIAILLNITPDHLAWHGTIDNYCAAKAKIFNKAEHKIIATDDEYCKAIADNQADAQRFSIHDEHLPFNPSDFPKMKGSHALQNMLAAYHACQKAGLKHDDIIEGMKSFEGLAHRQHLVKVLNGIAYINDSKATNAEATRAALTSYRNIIWLAGGQSKDGGLKGLEQDLDNVQRAYLFGESAQDYSNFLKPCGVENTIFATLDEAFTAAHEHAQTMKGEPGGTPTILLSPASASFDQYQNFEQRGDHFVTLVMELDDE